MIRVTCAVIRNEDNEVLVVQRGASTDHPLKWEFPGGKIAEGETDEECIIREVIEELSMDIVICSRLAGVEYDYGKKQILLIPFVCDTLDDLPHLSEHIAYKWIRPDELKSIDFSEADIFVAENYLNRAEAVNKPENNIVSQKVTANDDPDLQSMVNNLMGMKEAEWIAVSAIENPAIFLKLLEFSLSSDKNLSFRASWTLTKVCDKFPEIIDPYLSDIVTYLSQLSDDSTLRSFLRILSMSDLTKIDKHQHGILAEFCFNSLNSGVSAIAVKAYCMEILYKLSLIYNELANELAASISVLIEDSSAGITSRGRTILRKLSGMKVKPGKSE